MRTTICLVAWTRTTAAAARARSMCRRRRLLGVRTTTRACDQQQPVKARTVRASHVPRSWQLGFAIRLLIWVSAAARALPRPPWSPLRSLLLGPQGHRPPRARAATPRPAACWPTMRLAAMCLGGRTTRATAATCTSPRAGAAQQAITRAAMRTTICLVAWTRTTGAAARARSMCRHRRLLRRLLGVRTTTRAFGQ